MPVGNMARLHMVLRAGENQVQAMYTGAPGDSALKLKGVDAANALKVKKAQSLGNVVTKGDPDDYQPDSGQDAGAAPVLPARAKTVPAVMDKDGFTFVKGPAPAKKTLKNDRGDQMFGKNSRVVDDIVNRYREAAEERGEELSRARKNAEDCAQRRRDAVSEYQQKQEAAADAAIKRLQEELAEKEARIDDLQNASDEALKELKTAKDSGSASSAEVERLLALVSQVTLEKTSVEKELAAFKVSCDEERDAANELAKTALEEAEAEADRKLKACEAKHAVAESAAAKKLEECLEELKVEQTKLLKETEAHNALEKEKEEQEDKFHAAARAACAALKDYQDNKDERFRKKTLDFVTKAPASKVDLQNAQVAPESA